MPHPFFCHSQVTPWLKASNSQLQLTLFVHKELELSQLFIRHEPDNEEQLIPMKPCGQQPLEAPALYNAKMLEVCGWALALTWWSWLPPTICTLLTGPALAWSTGYGKQGSRWQGRAPSLQ